MHKVSRMLLVAGVLAFGTLTAACGDKVELVQPTTAQGVTNVSVSPSNASINVGTTIQLAASVSADAATAKTVTWTTSNAAVASVDQTGKVTGVSAGTVTIIATSTADASKNSAAAITVIAATVPNLPNPSIAINSVTQGGIPVNLGNTAGQIDVTVNTSGGGLIEVFLSTSCTTNTIAAGDVAVATQQATSAQAGQVTLSINTAQLTAANAPRFANGNYCIKTRLTNGASVVVATNTTPITLNNVNVFRSTATFASQTGGPTSAVSTLNGLSYNQGTLTATVSPVIFTSTSPVALISGYLTRTGQTNGVTLPTGPAVFNNVAVTNGVATIVFPDTAGAAASRSIFQYTSLTSGDTLVITAATDAAGNSIAITNNNVPTIGFAGLRIDNDAPTLAGAYTVTAPNGYIGAAYVFSSGTSGAASTDTKLGVQGVGGVTTTYFVGPVGAAGFATANSCSTTGLTAATTAADLANTTSTDANDAKVIVRDALGNQVCTDIASSFAPLFFFGVDKIAPSVSMTTANNGAADVTGYNVSKNFSFIYNDTISGFNAATPLRGTLVRNFYSAPSAANCVIGTFNGTTLACSAADITVTSNFGVPPNAGGSIEFTNGTAVVGYYTVTAAARDRALNSSATVTRVAAFDNVAPAIGGLTQSPAAVASLGTVTVSGTATDNFDLATSRGNLSYATSPNPFQAVGGTSFGPNFDATLVASGTASVSLSNVYRGLQSVDGAGVIQANRATPTATITVTDVGTNTATSAALPIVTSTAGANIQVGNTLSATPTSGAPASRQGTTTITVQVGGAVADPAFQSQPFAQIDLYQSVNGELVLVATNMLASVTDVGANRTYTYITGGVALVPAATNTFFAIGRNAAGDAVISNAITVVNP